jgi:hypothetical protein
MTMSANNLPRANARGLSSNHRQLLMLMAILLSVTALTLRTSLLAFTSGTHSYGMATAKEVIADMWMPVVLMDNATSTLTTTEVDVRPKTTVTSFNKTSAPSLPSKVSASADLSSPNEPNRYETKRNEKKRNETKRNESDLLAPYLPLKVFQQYQKWHSAESLEKYPHNRTFAVGYYSCPLESGNRLHHFFNGLLWAVVTNRTYLWKYLDRETCLASPKDGRHLFNCNATNHVEDCDAVLERAAWLPSYDEWAPKLSLDEPHSLHYWSTRPKTLPWYATQGHSWRPEYANETGVDTRNEQVVTFPRMVEVIDYIATEKNRKLLLRTEAARDTAREIYSLGQNFMFGMFFRQLFTMVEESLVKTQKEPIDPSVYSVGLHSRHVKTKYDGDDVRRETRCLVKLLQDEKRGNRTCEVYLMSDRKWTITKLQKFIESSSNCTVRVATHETGKGVHDEHGPWSGLGFYQDWALSSRARHGFVHTGTTSSSLVIEMITYDYHLEAWRDGRNATHALEECKFQPKYHLK